MTSLTGIFCSSAAASTNGLNVDPVWKPTPLKLMAAPAAVDVVVVRRVLVALLGAPDAVLRHDLDVAGARLHDADGGAVPVGHRDLGEDRGLRGGLRGE
jgi:hypothetical protein